MLPRKPGSYEAVITKVMGNLSPEVAAAAVGKSESLVRAWANPDSDNLPNLKQAEWLDQAYLQAGLGEAPIARLYAERVHAVRAPAHSPACPGGRLANAAKEFGEAADIWRAMMSGKTLSLNERAEIDRELSEAIDALEAMRRDVLAHGTGPKAVQS